ncbi:hypothetical protein EYZ11_013568 [Aspergillus tanneri]|uniref:Uncharacterized protein n=1 Tax=Aspergillus tanneri TaxID=1220188 RepID=A0A4S3IXC8_9EURO|nr:hypothetical protein EYZ11_013568 [Aspergillus tanneri]
MLYLPFARLSQHNALVAPPASRPASPTTSFSGTVCRAP